MEQRIRERFNDRILHEAMRRYGIPGENIRLLDGFESFMYEYNLECNEYVLRLSHSIRRTPELIHGEIDWLNHLHAHGVGVARAIASNNGELVEAIEDDHGGYFLVTSFEKAKGRRLPREQWTSDFFIAYGELIGQMHRLARTYEPSRRQWHRGHWNDPGMLYADRFLPSDQVVARERFHALLGRLSRLPRDKETYGIIHQDAHFGNFFVDDTGRITLFDFDDCVYSWYANDIAIVMFYLLAGADDKPSLTRAFLPPFFEGYNRFNRLGGEWLSRLADFLKLREIDLYGVIYRSFDVANLSGDNFVTRFMEGRRERIENDLPYVEIDFREFERYV